MNIVRVAKTLSIAAVATLVLGMASTASAEDQRCSVNSLKGTFAYTSTGFIVAAPIPPIVGPFAEVGTQSFDGEGNVTFTYNVGQNGNVGPGTATGTYTVNDDCTGTFTETSQGFTAHFSFVIDNRGNGFQSICQDTGVVITRLGRKQNADDGHYLRD